MPAWYPDFDSLGYEVNSKGQIRDKKTGELYRYFETDNEKANEERNESFHQAINTHLLNALRVYGIKETFLTGRGGRDVQQVRPTKASHITILATDFQQLKQKKNVVVIIPDSKQDLGILSYQELRGAGGFDAGSVLGIVKTLQGLDLREKEEEEKEEKKEEERSKVPLTPIHDGTSFARDFATVADDMTADDIPGVIVLNPGQLLYSHKHKVNMGVRGWTSQSGPHALSSPPQIHDQYNRVQGHASPQQHVGTVLRKILQRKLGEGTRLFFVAVGDSADFLFNYMDHYLSYRAPANMVRKHTTKAIALIHPTFDIDQAKSELARTKVLSMGRLWILSGWKLGTVLTTSETGVVEEVYASEKLLSAPLATKQNVPSPVDTEPDEDVNEIFGKAAGESNTQPEGMLDQLNAIQKPAALPIPSDGRGILRSHRPQDRHYLMGCSPPKNDGPIFPTRLTDKSSLASSASRSTIESEEERRLREAEAMRADNSSIFMPFQISSMSLENAGLNATQKADIEKRLLEDGLKIVRDKEGNSHPRPSDLPPRYTIPVQAPVTRSEMQYSAFTSWDKRDVAVTSTGNRIPKDSRPIEESNLMRDGDFDDDDSGMYMKGSRKISRTAGQDDAQPFDVEEYVMPASDIDEDRPTETVGTSEPFADDLLYRQAKITTGESADGAESAQSAESKDGSDDREPSIPDLSIEDEQSAGDPGNGKNTDGSYDTASSVPELDTDNGSSDGGVSVDMHQGGNVADGSLDYPSDSESENESEGDNGVNEQAAARADLQNTLSAALREGNQPPLSANEAAVFKPTLDSDKIKAINNAVGDDTDDDNSATASEHNDHDYSAPDTDIDTKDTGIHFPDTRVPAPDVGNLLRVSGGCQDAVERILPGAQRDVLLWLKAMANRQTK